MADYDVVVIGAGAAGLCAGALLAKEGKRVAVVERSPWLGGRGMAVPEEGYRLNWGGHLLEDPGSGITKIFEHVGKTLGHGTVSSGMPVWEDGSWKSVTDLYSSSKDELKKLIKTLVDTPWEELDQWDDRPLREWLVQHTSDEGVISLWEYLAVLECMTDDWWDHSASDNLFIRKMHYGERRMAGYSFWPEGGWDGIFADITDAFTEHGGELLMKTSVERVIIEDQKIEGVEISRGKVLPNEFGEGEVLSCDAVISTLPVWHVLNVVWPQDLPEWYVEQIRFIGQDRWRIAWLGLYLATDEPAYVLDPTELATWRSGPITGLGGFFFDMSAMDPTVAPEGKHLHVCGAPFYAPLAHDKRWVMENFERFEEELQIMYPALKNTLWRRRHLVFEPSFGVVQKPGLVGMYRPHWRAPNVEGLWFASETFRSRGVGVDRAARAGLTCVEEYLGRRLPGFEGTWRY